MKQFLSLLLCCLLTANYLQAQSKVFKEVSDEISTNMELIMQDGGLVGYLAFTKLEKASEDSFNYKITIMDENLNDIGTVNFREENLELQSVSFEQDVLCLAYFKSTVKGQEFKSNKAYKNAGENSKNAVVIQFLNLDGKIIKQNNISVNVKQDNSNKYYTTGSRFVVYTALKHSLKLINIPQKGFACIYGDEDINRLIAYNTSGNELWKKTIDEAQYFSLLTTAEEVYLLSKKKDVFDEAGYSIEGFAFTDGSSNVKYKLEDKEGYQLKVLGFGTDQNTGKPYVSGNIISKKRGQKYDNGKGIASGAYIGVFSINFNGPKKSDISEVFSYWSDGSQLPAITTKGKFTENKTFTRYSSSVRDFQGNTYFMGSSFIRRPKWGSIGFSILFLPAIIISPIILAGGTQKCKIKDAAVLKQDAKGNISFDNTIDCNSSRFNQSRVPFSYYDNKKFYNVANSNTKTNYVIVDDEKDIVIYNINQKKIVRTIPHKEGKSRINIYPAKEGHVMVSEYNKKEKYTRFSIEAL